MGRGNVRVTGSCEGLYYIDNNDYYVYRWDDSTTDELETRLMRNLTHEELTGNDWLYDEWGTEEEAEDILECFVNDFVQLFPSFSKTCPNEWLGGSVRVILESKLFYIGIEDNEWSLAVKLIQKEEPWGFNWMGNLQKRLYQRYLDGMKTCLLDRLPSIGIYAGAWTSGRITRDEVLVG